MRATYHNHTTFSDGQSTLAELIQYCQEHQIDELGIADHLTLHPTDEHIPWAMPTQHYDEYVDAVKSCQDLESPTIRLGVEVDWFPEQHDVIDNALARHPFDYVLGSVHFVDNHNIDKNAAFWETRSQNDRNDIGRKYWTLIQSMAESNLFDIVAHADLYKKFAIGPRDIDNCQEMNNALDAIAKHGLVVELNTSGWHKPAKDAYPSLTILKACRKRDIPVTISADAHLASHLCRDFDHAAKRLKEAGYTNICRFEKRTFWEEPIDLAI